MICVQRGMKFKVGDKVVFTHRPSANCPPDRREFYKKFNGQSFEVLELNDLDEENPYLISMPRLDGYSNTWVGEHELTEGGKKVSLLTKLLKPDQALVQEFYTDDCGKLNFDNEDVQKAIYDLIEKDLIASAKERKAEEKKKG